MPSAFSQSAVVAGPRVGAPGSLIAPGRTVTWAADAGLGWTAGSRAAAAVAALTAAVLTVAGLPTAAGLTAAGPTAAAAAAMAAVTAVTPTARVILASCMQAP